MILFPTGAFLFGSRRGVVFLFLVYPAQVLLTLMAGLEQLRLCSSL